MPANDSSIGTGSDILIVDDTETNLVAYEAALEPLGRTVVIARSGRAALEQLLVRNFAIVLLDYSMPEITGIETARMVRARPRTKDTPILFISGVSPSREMLLEAFDVGALDFILKPILPEILRAKVTVYLQLQERTTQLRQHGKLLSEALEHLRAAANDHEQERAAAIRTALRLENLQDVTTKLADTRTPEQVAAVVVRAGRAAVAANAAAFWLANPDGSLGLVASHGAHLPYAASWQTLPSDSDLPPAQVLRTARPMWIETEGDYAREAPAAIERVRASNRVFPLAVLPLMREGQAIGVVLFTYEHPHQITAEERRFLSTLIRASEQALERARLHVAEAKARDAAELANKRKDEFLAMLGHELRNPLAAIRSAAELVRVRGAGLEREAEILQRQLTELTHILDDLLDVSRITRGLITLQRTTVELRTAVEQALEMVQPEVARLEHQLTIEVPPDVLVDADRTRLVQVIANLLSNAVRYTQPKGVISVTAEVAAELVTIHVRDNGRGIAPTLLSDMFDLFVQGERSLDRRDGGLGVGLTLVRTLVDLHGGAIEVKSDGDGRGSTFTLRWPRATAPAEVPAPAAAPSPPVPASSPLRVLVVDDNIDAAEMLGSLLELLDHVVKVAHHGETALQTAAHFGPDVVLLDIGLPGLDGYEVAKRMRALPSCANAVLVAVTGYGAPEDIAHSRDAGFAEHLVKPIDPARLRALLAHLSQPAQLLS